MKYDAITAMVVLSAKRACSGLLQASAASRVRLADAAGASAPVRRRAMSTPRRSSASAMAVTTDTVSPLSPFRSEVGKARGVGSGASLDAKASRHSLLAPASHSQ